jgi:hypothetical protein
MSADKNSEEKKTLTRAEAAKLVKRTVPVLDDDGQQKLNRNDEPVFKKVAIDEDEILNFADYDDRVVVVTTQGEKLVHTK